MTHSFWFRVEAAVWAWILVSMVARSGQQPRGHCRNSLSCKRPLVERLSTVWSSQTCGVGLAKNSLKEKGGWRCLVYFPLMCVKHLTPLFSTEKELARTFECTHTDYSVSDGQNVATVQVFYATQMSRLAVNTVAMNLAGLLVLIPTWQQSSTILFPPDEV